MLETNPYSGLVFLCGIDGNDPKFVADAMSLSRNPYRLAICRLDRLLKE